MTWRMRGPRRVLYSPSWLVCAMLGLAICRPVSGAVVALEDFDDGLNGWTTRDAAEMAISWDNVNLWAVGQYGSQVFPSLEDDAFRFDTVGGNFTGDYSDLTQIRFNLNPVNVLPSSLWLRIIDGSDVYEHQIPLAGGVNSFHTYTVDLTWSAGWGLGNEQDFLDALTSVDAVEVQVVRSGTGAQSYYLDNFETLDTDLGGGGDPGGPGGAVPEPNTLTLLGMMVAFAVSAGRRRWTRRHAA